MSKILITTNNNNKKEEWMFSCKSSPYNIRRKVQISAKYLFKIVSWHYSGHWMAPPAGMQGKRTWAGFFNEILKVNGTFLETKVRHYKAEAGMDWFLIALFPKLSWMEVIYLLWGQDSKIQLMLWIPWMLHPTDGLYIFFSPSTECWLVAAVTKREIL